MNNYHMCTGYMQVKPSLHTHYDLCRNKPYNVKTCSEEEKEFLNQLGVFSDSEPVYTLC